LRLSRREIAAPSKLERLQSCQTGFTAQKNLRATLPGQQGGRSSGNIQHLTDYSLLLFADPISSIVSNHHKNNSDGL
jgi:hypothetical protein